MKEYFILHLKTGWINHHIVQNQYVVKGMCLYEVVKCLQKSGSVQALARDACHLNVTGISDAFWLPNFQKKLGNEEASDQGQEKRKVN
jgi:hypothetical protein